MYGKIENGSLTTSGMVMYTEKEQIFNATEEMWLAHGWKIVVIDEYLGDEYIPSIKETETRILVHWVMG